MRTRTKAKIAGKTAKALAESAALRKAAMTAGPPVVKVRFGIARRRARRRAQERAVRLQEAVRTVTELVTTYGPQAAEVLGQTAEVLGLAEPPRKRSRGPSIAFGAVLGAAAVYFLDPASGSGRRAMLLGAKGSASA